MLKTTGIIRKSDTLGRIIIPYEARHILNIEDQDEMEVLIDEEQGHLILRKPLKVCFQCRSTENLKQIKAHQYICDECIDRIR